ncbi:MAG: diguanylate cyclase [Rhodocyclaceae bacterium]|nr:diguanylate cyclase [Rhodocyclaceae bacterium]MBX3669366.1 diguanylate cyclase [Rhodocyclaceae bacterium]
MLSEQLRPAKFVSRRNVVAGAFALLLLATLAVSWQWWRQIDSARESMNRVQRGYAVVAALERLQGDIIDVETGARGYVITGRNDFLEPYHAALHDLSGDSALLRSLMLADGSLADQLAALLPLVDDKLKISSRQIDIRRMQGFAAAAAAVSSGEGKQKMDQIRAQVEHMIQDEERLLNERRADQERAAQRVLWVVLALAALMMVVLTTLAYTLHRALRYYDLSSRRLRELANHDALTGLPNRRFFEHAFNAALDLAQRKKRLAALLFLDLDGFKAVNDTLGHDAGDKLLRMAGKRLRECLRASDFVARLGGDEFVVALPDLQDESEAKRVAQKIIDTLAQDYDLDGKTGHVTVSVGITIFPRDGDSSEQLLQHADDALYAAKTAGKNRFVMHEFVFAA